MRHLGRDSGNRIPMFDDLAALDAEEVKEGCRCVTRLAFRRGEDKIALRHDQVPLGVGQSLPGFRYRLECGTETVKPIAPPSNCAGCRSWSRYSR